MSFFITVKIKNNSAQLCSDTSTFQVALLTTMPHYSEMGPSFQQCLYLALIFGGLRREARSGSVDVSYASIW